ncbi:MAG: dihydrofolate reductase family protein [Nocardioidaceae bacterium]
MSTVVMHNVVSVDGFIADDQDQIGPLFDWYFNGDTPLTDDGAFKVSRQSAEYTRQAWDGTGAMVIGRHLFDLVDGWNGKPPAGEHVVVVSHRPKPDGWHPEASYHFLDDVAAAVDTARELAGQRNVAVAAGDVGGQALARGLVDEVAMDVVPVVFGSGKRYFGPIEGVHLLQDPDMVVQGNRVRTCATGCAMAEGWPHTPGLPDGTMASRPATTTNRIARVPRGRDRKD